MLSTGCGCTRTIIREFPDRFQGWVFVVYGVDGASPLPKDHGNDVLKIPADGILITSTPQYTGWEHIENYYVDASGKRLRELKEQNAQGGATGLLDANYPKCSTYFTFVGPLDAYQSEDEFGSKQVEAERRARLKLGAKRN